MKPIVWALLGSWILLLGCESTEQSARIPAKELYYQATIAIEDDFLRQAQELLQTLITENPGTQLTTWSYLRLGEIQKDLGQWEEAEANYRMFLTLNPKSHLTPYVLGQLIALNYNRNFQGILFQERDYDRDMDPNRKIIQDYDRFFLLYPQSVYLGEIHEYLLKARQDLAEHEFLVGNFYFEQEAYGSAILRYQGLLKQYPEYPKTLDVVQNLIDAYQRNQQPNLAEEMQNAMDRRFDSQSFTPAKNDVP